MMDRQLFSAKVCKKSIFLHTFVILKCKDMNDFKSIASYVNEAVANIEYPATPDGLFQPIRYMLSGGGKRLRPVLLIATCQALCADGPRALNQALGIEMFHNFTLLHDDVMDNSPTRHGRPTVHMQWDVPTAILSGDAMLTMASRLMMRCPDSDMRRVVETFDSVAMDVYRGQQFDMEFETRTDVKVEEYMEMIRLKTAVLLAGACKIGALMAHADEGDIQAMWDYATNLGLAFQLRDDYLDTFGSTEVFGKPIGGDILNEKKTWLLITAMSEAPEKLKEALAAPSDSEKIAAVKAVYDSLNLSGRCSALVEDYASKAEKSLDDVKMADEWRERFAQFASGLSSRNH